MRQATVAPEDIVYPDRPVAGVLAVVRRGTRVLLVRRARAPDAGRWGFPGGSQHLGETAFMAAMRELAEETGVSAEAVDTLSAFDVIDLDPDGLVRFHYSMVAVLAEWREHEGVAADDALATVWATPEEIDGLEVCDGVSDLARQALAWPDENGLEPGLRGIVRR